MRVLHASPPPSSCSLPNTTPAPNCTNNPFHALENENNNDTPGATTWSPPPLPASVPQTPVQRARVTPFQQAMPTRLVFDDVASPSVPTTTPKPSQLPLPRVSKTLSPIAHCTRSRLAPPQLISLMELMQYHHIPTAKTTRPQNTLASQFADLCQALALSKPETTELMRVTALRSWIRNLATYLSIANSDKTLARKKFGTAPILMNLGICAKALVWVTKPAANKLQGPTHST